MTLVEHLTTLTAAVRNKFNLVTPRLLPEGGAGGYVLTKASSSDYDASWAAPTGGGSTNVEGGNASSIAVANVDGGAAAG